MIQMLAQLRSLCGAPGERALRKQMDGLDVHAARFIALSPFGALAETEEQMLGRYREQLAQEARPSR